MPLDDKKNNADKDRSKRQRATDRRNDIHYKNARNTRMADYPNIDRNIERCHKRRNSDRILNCFKKNGEGKEVCKKNKKIVTHENVPLFVHYSITPQYKQSDNCGQKYKFSNIARHHM